MSSYLFSSGGKALDLVKKIKKIMRAAPGLPVLVVDDAVKAGPMTAALVSDEYPVLEITLRTPCALEVIAEMNKVEGAIVGAGTVTNPDELNAATIST